MIIPRLVRYKKGGVFAPHEDNCFSKSNNDRSFWTVNIYLNDVYEKNGGATQFIYNGEIGKRKSSDTGKFLFYISSKVQKNNMSS